MRNGKIIASLLAILLLMGCATPESDARKALAAGDRRLVGYMGIELIVPGTPAGFQVATYEPGVRVLPGITDVDSSNQSKKAQAYAARYNRVVLESAR